MAYFLKTNTKKGRTYISIVESIYSADKKGGIHKTYKSLGSVETHKKNGIEDPIAHFQKEVDELNLSKKETKELLISDVPCIKHLGYFPLKAIMEKMKIKNFIDLFKLTTDFKFDLYDILSSLVYARAVYPCSKRRTYYDVIPTLYGKCGFSYDQLLEALAFYGNDYEKFVELFTTQSMKYFNIDTSKTYFDCTNFYFEIDREDDFRRKGPSKENRKDPIVGMGLLLDANQIPIGMKLYPGNESEKPVLRDVIDSLKERHNITGKTVHVADKGLNCAENIYKSLNNGDGYLFSKSVKQLPEKEKVWVKLENDDWVNVYDNNHKLKYKYKSCIDDFEYTIKDNGKKRKITLTEKRLLTYSPSLAAKKRYEINKMVEKAKSLSSYSNKKAEYGESAKYVNFVSINEEGVVEGKALATLNEKLIQTDLDYAGYNLLVTSEINMSDEDIYNTYHNLWRIEESFKIMKSDLDARPVFLQLEETINGHFLICYITVLLERIFQFFILENKHSTSEIFRFFRDFKVVKSDTNYINVSSSNDFIKSLADTTNLPLLNLNLMDSQIKKVMNYKV